MEIDIYGTCMNNKKIPDWATNNTYGKKKKKEKKNTNLWKENTTHMKNGLYWKTILSYYQWKILLQQITLLKNFGNLLPLAPFPFI
jgi:hypothetical protein